MSCLNVQSSQDPSKKQTSQSAWKKQRPEELSGKDNLKFVKLSEDSTVNPRFPAFLCSHNAGWTLGLQVSSRHLWSCIRTLFYIPIRNPKEAHWFIVSLNWISGASFFSLSSVPYQERETVFLFSIGKVWRSMPCQMEHFLLSLGSLEWVKVWWPLYIWAFSFPFLGPALGETLPMFTYCDR